MNTKIFFGLIVSLCLLLVVLIFVIALVILFPGGRPAPKAEIISPIENALAPRFEIVRFKADFRFSPDVQFWVFVQSPNNRFYPQSMNACSGVPQKPYLVERISNILFTNAYLGEPQDHNLEFTILVLGVSEQTADVLSDKFAEWCIKRSYPGLTAAEYGQLEAQLLDMVKVRRK